MESVLNEKAPMWWLLGVSCYLFASIVLPNFVYLTFAYIGTEFIELPANYVGFIQSGFDLLAFMNILLITYLLTSFAWDLWAPAIYRIYQKRQGV